MWSTPPRDDGEVEGFGGVPETPGPIRAKVNHLTKQVSELVGKEHAAMVSVLGSWHSYGAEKGVETTQSGASGTGKQDRRSEGPTRRDRSGFERCASHARVDAEGAGAMQGGW